MPSYSFQPQSIGKRQLNFRKGAGPYSSLVDAVVTAASGETPMAGRVGHINADGDLVLGLVAGKAPVYIFTDYEDPVTARAEIGQMAGGTYTVYRHLSAGEFASTEFVAALSSATVGQALTSADASTDAAADSGKLRAAGAGEPVVGYVTKPVYKGAEGHDLVDFIPAYIAGTFA